MLCGQTVYGNQLFCCTRHRYKYYHSGDLVLTLKKQWFDTILSGVKTEEYRKSSPIGTRDLITISDSTMIFLQKNQRLYGIHKIKPLYSVMGMEMISPNFPQNVPLVKDLE